jgi:hypothetical protein
MKGLSKCVFTLQLLLMRLCSHIEEPPHSCDLHQIRKGSPTCGLSWLCKGCQNALTPCTCSCCGCARISRSLHTPAPWITLERVLLHAACLGYKGCQNVLSPCTRACCGCARISRSLHTPAPWITLERVLLHAACLGYERGVELMSPLQ